MNIPGNRKRHLRWKLIIGSFSLILVLISSPSGTFADDIGNVDIDAPGCAQDAYSEIGSALTRLVDGEYQALLRALDAAAVPWTPGRGVIQPN